MKRIRSYRRSWLTLLMVGFFFAVTLRAEDVDKLPKPTSYVSDLAHVFDAASQQQMEDLCTQVDQKAHAQIAVVTVNDTGGEEIQAFTHDLQQKWGVGNKGTDRGITMVFAVKDRKRWIEVSYGLEGILNDAKVGDIGREMVPDLRAGQYGPAALHGVQRIADVIATDAKVTLDAPVQHTYRRVPANQNNGGSVLGTIIVFVVIVVFIILVSGRGGRGGGGGGSFLPGLLMGMFLGGGRGGGGGDFGGGGGNDSGGGGGGFGGFGGGDSGGGGAGGDW